MSWMRSIIFWPLLLLATSGFAQEKNGQVPPGPVAQKGKSVVFVASDFRNGGVMGAYRSFEGATKKLGWKIQLEDGMGQQATQRKALAQALAARPNGIVFGGFDPDAFSDLVVQAKRNGIVLVGWHAAETSGPTNSLFVNVSTKSDDVAKLAADYVINDAKAKKRAVGVVIFNDNQFAVANAKANAMARIVQKCAGYDGCKILSIENLPISDVSQKMRLIVPELVSKYGPAWTYSLAINDIYFDEMNHPLREAKRTDILNVAAGDGSAKALSRIGAAVSQQVATVAEPLGMQGYQLADELNRAFAEASPSGFQTMPILVTTEVLKATGNKGLEANIGFEAAYTTIWGKQ